MTTRHIETLTGKGIVTRADDTLSEASYKLNVYRKEMSNPALKDPVVHKELGREIVQGTVEPFLPDAYNSRERLTLAMEDGRKLKFQYRSRDGSIAFGGWLDE